MAGAPMPLLTSRGFAVSLTSRGFAVSLKSRGFAVSLTSHGFAVSGATGVFPCRVPGEPSGAHLPDHVGASAFTRACGYSFLKAIGFLRSWCHVLK